MVHVIAVVTTQPGQRAALIEAFQANAPTVRDEAGCLEYVGVIDHAGTRAAYGEDTFLVVEKWETLEHLKAHGKAPHMAAYAAKTKELVKDLAIHILSPV